MFGAYCDTLANYAIRQTKKRRKNKLQADFCSQSYKRDIKIIGRIKCFLLSGTTINHSQQK